MREAETSVLSKLSMSGSKGADVDDEDAAVAANQVRLVFEGCLPLIALLRSASSSNGANMAASSFVIRCYYVLLYEYLLTNLKSQNWSL